VIIKMTINRECVVKYLKHDYKELLKIVAIIAGAICIIAIAFVAFANGPAIIWPLLSPYWTGYNILTVFAAAIVILFTVGISACDKKFFEFKTKNSCGVELIVEETTGFIIGLALLCGFVPYSLYWIIYVLSNPKWEDPLLSTIVFIALILIGTPIGCAIAKCKE